MFSLSSGHVFLVYIREADQTSQSDLRGFRVSFACKARSSLFWNSMTVMVLECVQPVNLAFRIGMVVHAFCFQWTGACECAAVQCDLNLRMILLHFREWAMLALVFLCGWVGCQYVWSVLVLTGNVVGLVFNCLWPLGVGVFVIRHHRPNCSWLVFVKLNNVGYCKSFLLCFYSQRKSCEA